LNRLIRILGARSGLGSKCGGTLDGEGAGAGCGADDGSEAHLQDVIGVDRQKACCQANTRQFVQGLRPIMPCSGVPVAPGNHRWLRALRGGVREQGLRYD